MNILFIGGAGFIGSSLVKYFAKKGNDNLYVIEPEFANISRLEGINVKIHRCSLSDIDTI